MKQLFAIVSCLIFFGSIAQKPKKPSSANLFASFDTAFARVLKDWKAAGFAVAVVEKDKIIYAKGFGYKDYEAKLPVTPNTQFAIGSCTKAFTSSLIGLLDADNKVDIDKPVRNYLPALNFYNNEMNDNITLRDMMCHRTGVSRYDYSWYYFPSHSKDSLMQRMQYMEPSEPLRKKWQYNNFMFMLQGLVTEKITGESWEENIRKKILVPLEMDNTNASLAEWMKAKDISKGYNLKNDSIINKTDYYDIAGMAPAGSINSSVNDMAKWISMWINGGKYKGKEILPSAYLNEAISSQMVMAGGLPGKKADVFMSNYGFGWMLSSYRGHYRVEHGGNIDGFSASTCFFPSDSIGIIVLCNQNGSSVNAIVRNLVSDKLLGLEYRDWQMELYSADTAGKAKAKQALKTMTSIKKTGTKPSHATADYAGIYTAGGKENFEIATNGDSLVMMLPNNKFWLRHFHYDVFQLLDKDDILAKDTSEEGLKIMFAIDESGNIASASMPLEGTVKPIVFTKSAKALPVVKDSLQKYVGDYNLADVVLKAYIKNENKLYLFVPGQPEYELVPNEKDKFSLKGIPGFTVEFTVNAKGEVTELTSVQPNGSFKAVKIIKL